LVGKRVEVLQKVEALLMLAKVRKREKGKREGR